MADPRENMETTSDNLKGKGGGIQVIPLPEKEKEAPKPQNEETFNIDTNLIPKSSLRETDMDELAGLGLNIFNQDEFEQGVMNQVGQALAEEEEKRIRKIVEKELKGVEDDIKQTKADLVHIVKVVAQWSRSDSSSPEVKRRLEIVNKSKDVKLKQMKKLVSRKKVLEAKLLGVDLDSSDDDDGGIGQILKKEGGGFTETERERMIRVGEMTPFGTVISDSSSKQAKPSSSKEEETEEPKKDILRKYLLSKLEHKKGLKRQSETTSVSEETSPEKKLKADAEIKVDNFESAEVIQARLERRRKILPIGVQPEDVEEEEDGEIVDDDGDEDYVPIDNEYVDSDEEVATGSKGSDKTISKPRSISSKVTSAKVKQKKPVVFRKTKDDGDEKYFHKRIREFQKEELARQKEEEESEEDEEFDGGLVVPGRIWSKLFKYQRIGVRWLWELHGQEAGGIVGDEMGLGKTIQMIAFLASLRQSKLRNKNFRHTGLGPCIVVCPTTVMHQWVKEFHKWWPLFRVAILHSSGSHVGKDGDLVRSIVKDNGVIVTSYNTLVGCQDTVLHYNWHYVILDEGHKIRNPDAQATLACKQFRTAHRIILSGSPIQNNLKELWSLFDFIFPGKLGTLPDFMQHFSVPIVQGGYSNATQVQVETAYRCASILRDTINPFLLRRMKADVKANLELPEKTEQVLFCRLTDEQHDVYKQYLTSRECENILAGKYQIFAGLITLRKICNHPDISTGGPRVFDVKEYDQDETLNYGYYKRSGKMIVVEALLRLWKQQGHKVLLFSQSTKMLDILESFVQKHDYNYLRMDGTTAIAGRQPLITKFNQDKSIFVFLLTTRVGGLGVNLTGANRVVIFDPDWNPSTDMQARERAWRIGQQKQVTIYRLLTSGTIEEKIYHRQIFKQFLSNRVLKDPKQRRLFKSNDIYELFTLESKDNDEGTETSAIFAGTGSDVKLKKNSKNIFDEMKVEKEEKEKEVASVLEDEEVARMREFARKISRQMEQNKVKKSESASDSVPSKSIDKPSTSKSKITYADYKKMKLKKEGSSEKSKLKYETSEPSSSNHSSHKKHKKHKKKKRDAKLDGERIPNLVKQRKFKRGSDNDEDEKPTSKEDDYVLHTLFQKGGIHSAMKHDKIMECGRPDYAIVEAEAEKVAKQAVAALRKSRANCASALAGVPTWTGQNGGRRPRFGKKKSTLVLNGNSTVTSSATSTVDKKDESDKHFDGSVSGYVATNSTPMSSDELLSRMRNRQVPSGASVSDPAVESLSEKVDIAHTDLLTDIRNYVAFQARNDGQAMTQELLDHFGTRLPPSDTAKFKAMLKQLCHFDKSSGIGIWQLKEEFR